MEAQPIEYDVYTVKELLAMKHGEATRRLTEKQQRFCEFYVMNYNIKTALVKAGYAEDCTARGYVLRKNPECQLYIQWLKARILNETLVTGQDIIDQWVRIAFADMTDFVNIHKNGITLKKPTEMDGQLVKAIHTGKDGIRLELHDKMKALDSLSKYTIDMPKDYKRLLDERAMQLKEEEFKLKKRLYDISNREDQDDGFLEALKAAAPTVWGED